MPEHQSDHPQRGMAGPAPGIEGFRVRSVDGQIAGRVEQILHDELEHHFVVATGTWIFGRQVVLPVGSIIEVDTDSHTVLVDRTKREIKDAQPFVIEHELEGAPYAGIWWPWGR